MLSMRTSEQALIIRPAEDVFEEAVWGVEDAYTGDVDELSHVSQEAWLIKASPNAELPGPKFNI